MRTLIGFALLAAIAFAQPQEKLEFEVASIKPSPPRGPDSIPYGCNGGPGSDDPGRLTCGWFSPAYLITLAYQMKFLQIDGPEWLRDPHFDIIATVPKGTTKEQAATMWQNLLADRFGLRVHHENREAKYLELTVAKNGPKLKPVQPDASKRTWSMGGGANGSHLFFPKNTMAGLASVLEGPASMLIKDATGLTGEYEITLAWYSGDDANANVALPPPLPQALREQLGLQFTTKTGPIDMLVIDHIERTPTGN